MTTRGYQRIPPAAPSGLVQESTGDVSFPAGISLPNASGTAANLIQLGPVSTAGARIARNGSATVQFANGDGTANALMAGATFRSTNDLGSPSPNFSATYQTGYGLYIQNTGPYVCLTAGGTVALRVNSGLQTNLRVAATTKTANTSFTVADSGAVWDNSGAAAQITLTLPTATTAGLQYTAVNQGGGASWMKLQAVGSDRFGYNGTIGNPAGSLTSAAIYTSVTVTCVYGNIWSVTAVVGTPTLL